MKLRIVTGTTFVEGLGGVTSGSEDEHREGALDIPTTHDEKLYDLTVILGNRHRGTERQVSYTAMFTSEGEVSF